VNGSRGAATRATGRGGHLAASRDGRNLPVPVATADHPLRRVRLRRGLTQVELAGLAGLSYSYISMIECGRRKLTRRDHVNALAAALRVAPAEIVPSLSPGSDEWAPAPPAPVSAFPPAGDDIAVARHRDLAGQLIGYVSRGDTCAAGAWLRRTARDPSANPWLLLDQLTLLSSKNSRPLGGSGARLVSAGSTGRGRAG
jgi:transcriptional regulator with XRE-family HTH domain